MKPKKPRTLSDQLRQIIADCGMSRYEIAKRSGVPEAALSRFFNKKTGLSTDTLDRLAPALGLELVARRPAKRRAKKSKPKGG
jgi:transcriptional regulator with XRE-family HTH domain